MNETVQNGQTVKLQGSDGKTPKIIVDMAWDATKYKEEHPAERKEMACTLVAFLINKENGELCSCTDILDSQNTSHYSGCCMHLGSGLPGMMGASGEQIFFNLPEFPERYSKIVLCAHTTGGPLFGLDDLQLLMFHLINLSEGTQLCTYVPPLGDFDKKNLIFGELTREQDGWSFTAASEQTDDSELLKLAENFMKSRPKDWMEEELEQVK